jgi:hypothetical protein
MRRTNWTPRRKLLASFAVLGIVLVIATIAQFTGKDTRRNPYAATRAPDAKTPAKEAKKTPESSGRAVFGAEEARRSDTRPDPTSPTLPQAAEPQNDVELSTRGRTTDSADSNTAGINELLTRWRDTVAKGDLEGQTQLYAPKLDRFFRQRNVSHAQVRKVKSQMMSLYPTVNRYDISDVKVESNNGKEAVVSFRKEWEMKGQKPFSGAERQRLKLRRIGGEWKIVSEEETKVYWVKRS